jgi:hypothetical protein
MGREEYGAPRTNVPSPSLPVLNVHPSPHFAGEDSAKGRINVSRHLDTARESPGEPEDFLVRASYSSFCLGDSRLIKGISGGHQDSAKGNAELEQDLELGEAEVLLSPANIT